MTKEKAQAFPVTFPLDLAWDRTILPRTKDHLDIQELAVIFDVFDLILENLDDIKDVIPDFDAEQGNEDFMIDVRIIRTKIDRETEGVSYGY